jgi:hypothetical protein
MSLKGILSFAIFKKMIKSPQGVYEWYTHTKLIFILHGKNKYS